LFTSDLSPDLKMDTIEWIFQSIKMRCFCRVRVKRKCESLHKDKGTLGPMPSIPADLLGSTRELSTSSTSASDNKKHIRPEYYAGIMLA